MTPYAIPKTFLLLSSHRPRMTIHLAECSELVRRALGEHAFHAFIESEKIEWNEYRAQVTQWDLATYLPVL